KHAELTEDLVRWVEDEKRFEEYMKACSGQAGPVYKVRAEHPYWKTNPNYEGMLQNILRGVWIGYPGPITPAAIEVQAQYILCDMGDRSAAGAGACSGPTTGWATSSSRPSRCSCSRSSPIRSATRSTSR